MSAPRPRCPRCGSTDCDPCDELVGHGDEGFRATHECRGCHARFRVVPPQQDINSK
jgi:hypothetical protein